MKKSILVAAALSCSFANAETDKTALEGFYVGVGLCYSHMENEIKGYGQYNAAGALVNAQDYKISRTNTNKIGGTILAGYGTFFNNFYVGAEFALDVSKNKTVSSMYDMPEAENNTYNAKIKGISPSVALRLGRYIERLESLFYVKAGVAKISSEFQETARNGALYYIDDVRKLSQITPLIGVGIEKQVAGINLRLEGEYKFSINKNDRSVVNNGYYSPVKNKLSATSIRLVAAYNF